MARPRVSAGEAISSNSVMASPRFSVAEAISSNSVIARPRFSAGEAISNPDRRDYFSPPLGGPGDRISTPRAYEADRTSSPAGLALIPASEKAPAPAASREGAAAPPDPHLGSAEASLPAIPKALPDGVPAASATGDLPPSGLFDRPPAAAPPAGTSLEPATREIPAGIPVEIAAPFPEPEMPPDLPARGGGIRGETLDSAPLPPAEPASEQPAASSAVPAASGAGGESSSIGADFVTEPLEASSAAAAGRTVPEEDASAEAAPEIPEAAQSETAPGGSGGRSGADSEMTFGQGNGGTGERGGGSPARLDSPAGGSTAAPAFAFHLRRPGKRGAAASGTQPPADVAPSTGRAAAASPPPATGPGEAKATLHPAGPPPTLERMQRLQEVHGLAERLQARALLGKNGGAEALDIRLSPPALGPLRVQVEVHGEEMKLAFAADRPETARILVDIRPELTGLAQDRGYDLIQCEVNHHHAATGREADPDIADPSRPPRLPSPSAAHENGDESPGDAPPPRVLDFGYNTLDLVA
ncbi:MAG: flagellar hook-length control protein FliK [Candidatus Zixiibacteriota bacterium]|nr:MAG: flagellar hook-length control protein FliK [candidate division Zixibacteria bacterium]